VDPQTGALTAVSPYSGVTGGLATGMAADPSGKWLAVVDVNNDQLLLLTIDPTSGALTLAAGHTFPSGHRPNSVAFDKSGEFLYITNGDYPWFLTGGSNDISVYSFDPNTGAAAPLSGSPYSTGATSPSSITLAQ
jgi:6-phosphogluconolactonase